MNQKTRRLKAGQSGTAGEYYVAGELTRKGYVASMTIKNAKFIDVLAASQDGSRTIAIQVKTNQDSQKYWLVSKKAEEISNPAFFYVFVNLNCGDKPAFHVVPSNVVADQARSTHSKWLSGKKRDGSPRKDTDMRVFEDNSCQYLDKWGLLGL